MSLDMLPPELTEIIADVACKIRTNGKTSSNLRIVVRTQHQPSSCEAEAVHWVLRCLEHTRLERHRDGWNQYVWRVVSNVVNELRAPEHDGDATRYPELVVAIRAGASRCPFHDHQSDDDGLVVMEENPPRPELEIAANVFREIARDVPPPRFVTAVGVSAVSDEFMMKLWGDIISEEPDTLDGKGLGYMVHPMWMRMPDGGWATVREQSCIFGWEKYRVAP